MNRIYCFAIAAFVLLISGCKKADVDNLTEISNRTEPTFTASFENADTRTYIDNDLYMYWNADDRLSIFTSSYNEEYKFDGQTGETGGSFSKVNSGQFVSGNPVSANYGVYPYNPATKMTKDEKIDLSLPSVQPYAANTFGVGANTMVAVTNGTSDYFLPFKNLCGYLIVKLYGDGIVKRLVFEGNNGEKIAGAATVVASHNANPVVTMSDNATSSITIDCGQGIELGKTPETATEFWFVIPPTTFTKGFTIKAISSGVMQMTKSTTASRTIQRNVVNSMPAIEATFTPSVPIGSKAVLLPGPEFNAAIKSLAVPGTTKADYDYSIKRILLSVSDPYAEGTVVSAEDSPVPVFASFTPSSGVLTLSTAATSISTGQDASYLFYRLVSIESFDNLWFLDTESALDMSYMFCQGNPTDTTLYALKSLDVSSFNTTNCVNMRSMFNGCRALEHIDISNFNTSKCECTRYMFGNCSSLKEIDFSSFDFSLDTSMAYMFYCNHSLKTITFPENMNTSNVKNMDNMFRKCKSLTSLDLSSFNTSSVTNMRSLFYCCEKLVSLNLNSFDVSSCTLLNYMFYGCLSLTSLDLTSFNINHRPSMSYMFFQCPSLGTLRFGNGFIPEPKDLYSAIERSVLDSISAYNEYIDLVRGVSDSIAIANAAADFAYDINFFFGTIGGGDMDTAKVFAAIKEYARFISQYNTPQDTIYYYNGLDADNNPIIAGKPIQDLTLNDMSPNGLLGRYAYTSNGINGMYGIGIPTDQIFAHVIRILVYDTPFNKSTDITQQSLKVYVNGRLTSLMYLAASAIKSITYNDILAAKEAGRKAKIWSYNKALSQPSCFFASSNTLNQTSSIPGFLRIYCTQATANWLAVTTLRYINNGYYSYMQTPVTFIDPITNNILSVIWAED